MQWQIQPKIWLVIGFLLAVLGEDAQRKAFVLEPEGRLAGTTKYLDMTARQQPPEKEGPPQKEGRPQWEVDAEKIVAMHGPRSDVELPRDEWVLSSAQQARKAAIDILGRIAATDPPKDVDQPVVSASSEDLIELASDRGPFMSAGKKAWRVSFPRVQLALPSRAEAGRPNDDRRVECYFDPYDGKVRRIEIVNDASDVVPPPEPASAREYNRQLFAGGRESWGNQPDASPTFSLLKALDVVENDMGGVMAAKKIVVHYVHWSRDAWRHKEDENFVVCWNDVWCIDLRGIPPLQGVDEAVPIEARNHLRHVVDAHTGRWIMASTVPQPEKPPDGALPPPPPKPDRVLEGPGSAG